MIEKKGTNEKILQLAKTSAEFEQIRKDISKENELVRCSSCQHLMAKKSSQGYVDIQHRKEAMLIEGAKSVSIRCPVCGNIVNIL